MQKINIYNKDIKIEMSEDAYNENFEMIHNEIESMMEEGYDCGEVMGYNWSVVEYKLIKINGVLFKIDENIQNYEIKNILVKVSYNQDLFIDEIKKISFIESVYFEEFSNGKSETKTILFQEEKSIEKNAYTVSKSLPNSKVDKLVSITNSLFHAITEKKINEIKEIINSLDIDLVLDNLKFDGQFIDDWHSIFTILLKEYGYKYSPTDATVFKQ